MLDLDLNGEGSAGTGFSASFTEGDIPVRIVDTDVSITDVGLGDRVGDDHAEESAGWRRPGD